MFFVNLLIRIMVLFLMMGVGGYLHHIRILDKKTTHKIAKIFMLIFYPCMIFTFLTKNFTLNDILNESILPLGVFFIMLIGYIFGFFVIKLIAFKDQKEKQMFHFQCLINNYSFLPLPIVMMFFGDKIASKLLFSTLGAEFAIWTIGIFCLTGDKFNKNSIKNLFSPPVFAILFSFLFIFFRSLDFHTPILFKDTWDSIFFVIDMFGKSTIPAAMIVTGSRMYAIDFKGIFEKKQYYLSILRLLIIPASVALILKFFPFRLETYIKNIIIIIAIMPCAVNSVVLAEIFNSDTEFAAKTVLITHIFSLFTIPFWIWLLIY
jgi:predicted permease